MTYDYEDIISIVENLASSLLRESGITKPPVDPFVIAKKLKIPCTESRIEGRRGQNLVLRGHRIIDINKNDRHERKCFTLAHELIEVMLQMRIKDADERHEIAIFGAPYLLMPTEWFRNACVETDFDIFLLKRTFPTASHEAIAIRTLSFASAIITVIDDKKVTNRQSSVQGLVSRKLMPIERDATKEIYARGGKVQMKNEDCAVAGYPLFEEEVKRVILRTVPLDCPG
jgi:Zn-dependent peptidase ImmA (M78 family)